MRRDEKGQVAVMAIGLALVCFAIAGLAIDGARAMIARRSLQNVADTAAIAAASEVDAPRYYRSGGKELVLSAADAEDAATRLLARRGLDATTSLSIREEDVRIVLRSEVSTSFLRTVGIDVIPVAVSASARPFPQRIPIGR